MITNDKTTYEVWNLTPPVIPPRSRLYHLEPIGIGTPYVECLTSYTIRLAQAHNVSTGMLVKREILPLFFNSPVSRTQSYNFFSNHIKVLNGVNTWADKWVKILEELTLWNNLRFLTMLTWNQVLPPRGLLRRHRAWCPTCYEEWYQSGQIIYEPLLWTLEVVTMCPYHHQQLSLKCPICHKNLSALTFHARPGYCPYCNSWLGKSKESSDEAISTVEEIRRQSWVGETVGELLAMMPALSTLPKRERVSQVLTVWLQRSGGNISALTRALQEGGIQISYIRNWERGRQLMLLNNLLGICHYFGITPLQFFTQEPIPVPAPLASIQKNKQEPQPEQSNKRFNDEAIYNFLTEIVSKNETPPPSLRWIAKRVGRFREYLQSHFPIEYQTIKERYWAYRKQQLQKFEDVLNMVIENSENPPPPLTEVARRLNQNSYYLSKLFPGQCHQISERYRVYTQTQKIQRIQEICELVQRVTRQIFEQGQYPSMRRVIARLGDLGAVMMQIEARKAWEDTLRELGLRPPKN